MCSFVRHSLYCVVLVRVYQDQQHGGDTLVHIPTLLEVKVPPFLCIIYILIFLLVDRLYLSPTFNWSGVLYSVLSCRYVCLYMHIVG